MTYRITAVLVLFLCSAVTPFAHGQSRSPLLASAEREARLLVPELASRHASTEDPQNINAPLARVQRSDDWHAVLGLKQGTRVRVTFRQGPAVTGRVITVGQTTISTDKGVFVRNEVVQISRARFSQGLGVVSYMGLGALAGGVGGYIAAASSYDCHGCGERRLATVMGLIGGVFVGGMGGFVVGEVVHHQPEKVIYSRSQP